MATWAAHSIGAVYLQRQWWIRGKKPDKRIQQFLLSSGHQNNTGWPKS